MQIKNHMLIITGAGSGLGQACAAHFLQLGAKVAAFDLKFNGESTDDNLQQLVVDVTDESSITHALQQIDNTPIATLIQCAGIAPAKKILSRDGVMPQCDFEKVIQVNLLGSFNCMRLVAARMAEQKENKDGERGVIINTASVAAFEGQIGQTAYSASKGAICSMTLPAARELARSGIRVNAIAPGIFKTPMVAAMPEKVQESLIAQIPFPKRFGLPHEYALMAQQIIENPMLNGTTIRLDGAVRMGGS